mgnify:CR=1 FL=1
MAAADGGGSYATVTDADGGVVASTTGEVLTFRWEDSEAPGVYTVSAEFATRVPTATPLGWMLLITAIALAGAILLRRTA